MEEITNLMNAAQSAIENLESFIFENKKEKYINLKTVTTYMTSQIESAEMTVELQVEEEYEETKTRLNAIVSKCAELVEAFKAKDNIMVVVNENGEIVTQEINYANNQVPMEVSEEVAKEEVAPAAPAMEISNDSNEVLEEYQAFAPEIKEEPELEQSAFLESPIPEINILDDTATQTPQTDYTQDLDVDAVDAFLGSENQENTLKL